MPTIAMSKWAQGVVALQVSAIAVPGGRKHSQRTVYVPSLNGLVAELESPR
jgi:hypothetical protein